MAADARAPRWVLRNIAGRFREHRSRAARSAQQRAPEAVRLQAALEMHELGVRLYRQRMRREHPRADRTDIDRKVKDWLAEPPRSGQLRLPPRERGRGIR